MVVEFLSMLAVTYGYLGVFLVSLISSASIIIPIPSFIVLIGSVPFLDPPLIVIFASLGAAIGELVSYAVGFGGRNLVFIQKQKKKWQKQFDQAEKWFEKHGGFAVIIVFAATPLPHDVVGLLSGIIEYDVKKFFLATLIGKFIQSFFIVYITFYGLSFLGF